MKTIAITGTNGKTSTVSLTQQLLASKDYKSICLGTLGLHVDNEYMFDPILIGQDAIPNLIEELREYNQIDSFIYEAFSAPISAKLYDKTSLDIAVLTYIGEDHLDFHESRDNYINAKLRLFNEVLQKKGTVIYNINDESAARLEKICIQRDLNSLTFGFFEKCDLWVEKLVTKESYSQGVLVYKGNQHSFKVPFVGQPFLLNWLAALSVSLQFGISLKDLLMASETLKLPPGRFEYIGNYNGAKIFVDYAHTACALKAMLNIFREITEGKIYLVFGCGGNRDASKRGKMGSIAQRLADVVYITDDNPRDEDPKSIRNQIFDFCPKGIDVSDRKLAISLAINSLETSDVLVITGKGHEKTQEIKGVKQYFSDTETTLELLNELNNNHGV